MQILYLDDRVNKFLDSLEQSTLAKVYRGFDFLKRYGQHVIMPHTRYLRGGLYELRIRGQQEARLFYGIVGGEIVIVHCCVKKTDKIPPKELTIARQKLATIDHA